MLAADAPTEVGQTESLMGASIRSTIGVPLWKGEDILGVLQVDNRNAPGDAQRARRRAARACSPHNASLAVANARLIKRLVAAEERLQKENSFLKGREEKRRGGGKDVEIIGTSEAMQRGLEQLDKVVDTRVTVLIEGETGTGKELIAARRALPLAPPRQALRRAELRRARRRACSRASSSGTRRARSPARPRTRRASSRSPTAARSSSTRSREMPLSLQSKLLRALQEGEIRPVGATTAEARQRAHRRGDEPQPRGGGRRRAASARTSTTASRSSRSACRRCASAARTSRCSRRTSSSATPTSSASRSAASAQQTMELHAGLRLARQRARAPERGAAPRHPARPRRASPRPICSRRASARSRALVDARGRHARARSRR